MGFHCNLVFEKRKPVFVFFWGQELIEVPVNGHLLWVIEQYFYYDYFTGVTVECKGESFTCYAVCLVGTADLPGKSAVQAFTQFNGKSGCSFCEDEGEVVSVGKGHSRCYPFIPGRSKNMRNKDSVFQQGQLAQQRGSPVS